MGSCCDTDLQEERLPIIVLNPKNLLYDRAHRCRVKDIQPNGMIARADDYRGVDSPEFFIPFSKAKEDAPNWTARLGDGVFVVD